MDDPSVPGFQAASEYFAAVVDAVPPERYADRWSDEWTMLDLIGHGNRANVLAVEYYEHPAALAGPDYVLPENIAARGRQAVLDLGDDPVASVRAASIRAIALAQSAPDDAMVGTPFGEQRLADYLRSRTAELVLHGLDLGTDVEPPNIALEQCGAYLLGVAQWKGHGLDVIRALTGRGSLPEGFNVF